MKITEIKEVIGFANVPAVWKTSEYTEDDLFQRSENAKVDVLELQGRASELSNAVGLSLVPDNWKDGSVAANNLYTKVVGLQIPEIKSAIGYSSIPASWKDGTSGENLYSTQLSLTDQYTELTSIMDELSLDLTQQSGGLVLGAENIVTGLTGTLASLNSTPGINQRRSRPREAVQQHFLWRRLWGYRAIHCQCLFWPSYCRPEEAL